MILDTSIIDSNKFEISDQPIISNEVISAELFKKEVQGSNLSALKEYYNEKNLNSEYDDQTQILVEVTKISENFIDIDYGKFDLKLNFDEFKIKYHCLNSNEHFELRSNRNQTNLKLKNLKSGHCYSIQVLAIKESVLINQSKYYIVDTNAPPDCPVLKLRACNSKYITIEWARPNIYGDAHVVGYRIYINGKMEKTLPDYYTSFTLAEGESCIEYNFQIQAITADDNLTSTVSPILAVTWPGVNVTNFREIENDNQVLKVAWNEPVVTDKVKVSHFRVIAKSEVTNQVLIQGPLGSQIREAEFYGMNFGKQTLHLETYIYGSVEAFCSKPLIVDFGSKPQKPILFAQIESYEQRIKLDRITASLVNKRDKLLRMIPNSTIAKPSQENSKIQLSTVMSILRQVDDAINDCIRLIDKLTGLNFTFNIHSFKVRAIDVIALILNFKLLC